MSRTKKRRSHVRQYLREDSGPNKTERLENPNSYDSRKRKAQNDRKKHRSVYQKMMDEQKEAGANQESPKGGRLAEKIRKLNAEKSKDKNED